MKVAIVCPYDWSHAGGVRSHVAGLASWLRESGIEAEIIAPATSDEPGIFAAGGAIPIPFNGSVARICFTPGARNKIGERLGLGDIDVVHLHEPLIPSLSMLALSSSDLPAVATFHASAERSLGYATFSAPLGKVLRKLQGRIAVSDAAKALIERYFSVDIDVIPNAIDVSRFSGATPDSELTAHKPFVLFVGRAEPRKGFDVFIAAMEAVRASREVNVVVAGPPPEAVPGWAVGLGPIGDDRLPGVYASADVLCAPSRGGESFGYILVEAMAAGAPVVSSDIAPYVAVSGDAALHAGVDDPDATAAAICRILDDEALTARLRGAGSERARLYDWGTVGPKIVEQYERAVSSRTWTS